MFTNSSWLGRTRYNINEEGYVIRMNFFLCRLFTNSSRFLPVYLLLLRNHSNASLKTVRKSYFLFENKFHFPEMGCDVFSL